MQTQIRELQHSVLWLFLNLRKASSILTDAQQGKVESYIINEQEVIQKYMNFAIQNNSLYTPRTKVRTSLVLTKDQQIENIPSSIQECVKQIMLESDREMYSRVFEMAKCPQIKDKRIPADFYQPRLRTGFGMPKPPDVRLDTDIHISPRPHTAYRATSARSRLTGSASMRRPKTAVLSSEIGSMDGTDRLVNKVYHKWGY